MKITTLTQLETLIPAIANPEQTFDHTADLKQPQVIFFDAVGTLFGVRGSVGEQYAIVAQAHCKPGEEKLISIESLDRAFYAVFKRKGNPAFPEASSEQIPNLERQWWRSVVLETFQEAGVLNVLQDFEMFFEAVFSYFESAEPWIVYPDTRGVLDRLAQQGIPLSLISNFDSRLYAVLDALELRSYFQTITISTEVGAAKPDRLIFEQAIAKHQIEFHQACHVGDSRREDYEAAIAFGMQGVWVERI